MDGMKMFRVFNRSNYDIGITLTSGQQPIIRKGSFLPMTVNDILYLESIARGKKTPFSSGELVAVSDDGKDMKLEDLGGYTDTYSQKHSDENEIAATLKKSVKQVESWLDEIDDPVELFAIAKIAKKMDLPNSKMKLIKDRVPDIDMLDE